MSGRSYYLPTEHGDRVFAVEAPRIKFGRGALAELGEDARALGMTRVAVYTDPRVAEQEALARATASLQQSGVDAAVYAEVEVEPTDRSIRAGGRFASEGNFDGFVSVGGGSVMDTCKASNLYSSFPAELLEYVNAPIGRAAPIPGKLAPHIACPTTFGTASECTGIAVFDLLDEQAKTGIVSPRLRPSLGILDPLSLQTLPAGVRAANGFDVFSHACESWTARPFTHRDAPALPSERPLGQGANPYSDLASLEAIRRVGEHLIRGVNDPQIDDLEGLMFAGMLAGIGFGNAGCHLPHGMSYAVSGLVRDYRPAGWSPDHALVPHGISVILNAPAAFRFTGPACGERHLRAAEALGIDTDGTDPVEGGRLLADALIALMRATEIPNGLGAVGYGPGDLDALTDRAFSQKRLLDNAPRPVTRSELRELFASSLRCW